MICLLSANLLTKNSKITNPTQILFLTCFSEIPGNGHRCPSHIFPTPKSKKTTQKPLLDHKFFFGNLISKAVPFPSAMLIVDQIYTADSISTYSQCRFFTLSHQEKCISTMISNTTFLLAFLRIYSKWDQKYLYNIYEGRHIQNYLNNRHERMPFQALLGFARVTWFDQPILRFQLEEEESQTFFRNLIDWLDAISSQKTFEYAHKVKDKICPEENILWFNHQTYQQFPSWFANEVEKSIIKHYFNKGSLMTDNLERIKRLKVGIRKKFEKKQLKKENEEITNLLSMKLEEAKNHSEEDISTYQQRIKLYEDQYYEEVSLLIDHEEENEEKKVKKRKHKKRKNKKKNHNTTLNSNQENSQKQHQISLNQEIKNDQIPEQKIEEEKIQQREFFTTQEIKVKNESESKIQNSNSSQSHCSGYSHPELGISTERLIPKKRSLSPQNCVKQTKNEKTTKVTINEDLSQLDQFESQTSSMTQNFDEYVDEPMKNNKKRRKRKNQKNSLLKDLTKKLGGSLICRQLNNFIDGLSIQTNNLYDYKIVAFQRIRFFVQSLFPSVQTALFGSNAVGLSLPTSDIDILLFDLPCYTKEEAAEILAHLAVQINTMGWIVSCSAYLNAKVPLIKLQLDPTINYFCTKRKCDYIGMGMDLNYLAHLELPQNKKDRPNIKSIKVDLTVNLNDSNFGTQSTELMKTWMSEYSQLHRIILAFKYILAKKGFNSNFKGGIGSYCLFIMISAFLKENPETLELDEGQLFLAILKFYGEEFDNHLKSITLSANGPCFLTLDETLERLNTVEHGHEKDVLENLLRIFDPINTRIISGSCSLYNNIKAEFRRIYNEIEEAKQFLGKDIELSYNPSEASKLLESKKSMEKWLNKYQMRSGFSIKDVLNGGF